MAVTAKFQADFSGFIAAIDKAEVALVDLSKGAGKVEGSLNRMVDNFSGRKIIQEASLLTIAVEKAGGVATLTAKEIENVGAKAAEAAEKLKKLGYEVPAGLQKLADETKGATKNFDLMKSTVSTLAGAFGIAFSVGAVVNFGKELLASADALTKLHDKTGISIEGLQRFQVAGDDAGNTLDDITGAIVKMEDKLTSGDKSAVGALEKLGLSLEDLQHLSPENQFIAISDALRKIEDPAQQVSIAIDLFGKQGANVLPVLKRGFDDLKGSVVGMSEDTVKALDDAGDALARWWRIGKSVTADAIVQFVRLASAGFDPNVASANTLAREAEALNKKIEEMARTASAAAPKIKAIAPPGLPEDLKDIERTLDAQAAAIKKTAAEAVKAAEEHKKFRDSVNSLTSSAIGAVKGFGAFGQLMGDLSVQAGKFRETLDNLDASVNEFHNGITVAGDEMATVTIPMFSKLPDVAAQAGKAIKEATDVKTVDEFAAGIHTLNGLFVKLAQVSDGTFGGIVKWLAEVTASIELGAQAGETLKKAMDGQGTNWSQFATGAIGAVGAMDQATKSTNRWAATFGGAATGASIGGKIFPVVGAWIGAAAGALVGFFRSAGAAERAINPLREQFVQLNGGLAKLNERAKAAGVTLNAMLNAKNPEQYKAAIDALNDAFQIQDEATQVLDDTVKKYGFTLEELGPKFRQGKLDEAFLDLYKDQRVLTAAGIDFDTVIQKQTGSFQDLITTALKTGSTIPAALKPTIARMIELGLLTDENGDKLDDLGKLTFAETLDSKFDSLIDTINKLADAISRNLGTAINNIPTPTVHIPVVFDIPPYPERNNDNYASGGGLVNGNGIQYLAGGGVVSGGRLLRFSARGSDTVPAMLTPGEGVVSRRGMRTLGTSGLSALNHGRMPWNSDSGLLAEIRAMRADNKKMVRQMAADARRLPERLTAGMNGVRR